MLLNCLSADTPRFGAFVRVVGASQKAVEAKLKAVANAQSDPNAAIVLSVSLETPSHDLFTKPEHQQLPYRYAKASVGRMLTDNDARKVFAWVDAYTPQQISAEGFQQHLRSCKDVTVWLKAFQASAEFYWKQFYPLYPDARQDFVLTATEEKMR